MSTKFFGGSLSAQDSAPSIENPVVATMRSLLRDEIGQYTHCSLPIVDTSVLKKTHKGSEKE